ncbi:MAG TPA: VC0807 family protein [Dehalococcoidia bacterium]|nr:VC0807 family protein [Dehalococcoidia bacterium]
MTDEPVKAMGEPVEAAGKPKPRKRENPFLSLVLNVVIPSIILIRFSGEDALGPVRGLIIALAFPVVYGIFDLVWRRHVSFISVLGLASVILSGGIGLLRLEPQWLAVKEAAIPLVIGLALLISTRTPFSLVKKLISPVIDEERVYQALAERGAVAAYERRLNGTTYLLAGSFFLSAALNFALARLVVVSSPGTPAFNEELGRMTALSFPVITVPSLIVMVIAILYLVSGITRLTGLELPEILRQG